MSKVKFSEWQKIAKINNGGIEVVRFDVGDNECVEIEVTPRLSLTKRIALMNTVVDSCCPIPSYYQYNENTPDTWIATHRKPAIEYVEPVFRATVLRYYTNLDFSAEEADLEAIWWLACNDNVYDAIVEKVEDNLLDMKKDIYTKINTKMGNCEELAGRVLSVLDELEAAIPQKIVNDFTSLLKQSADLTQYKK